MDTDNSFSRSGSDELDFVRLYDAYIGNNDDEPHPVRSLDIDSKYYNIDDMFSACVTNTYFDYSALHLNVQGLASKFTGLKMMLSQIQDAGICFDFILLCETFLNDFNCDYFNIPGYNLVSKNRKSMNKGGVAIYIKHSINYKIRDDLSTFVEGEFESIFVEIMGTSPAIVGEIYRVPNTNINTGIQRYSDILDKLKHYRALY